jgi:serine/threonine protein kinase
MTLSAGSRLGQYEIVEQLGRGETGDVYRARGTDGGQEIALKLLPKTLMQDPGRTARFRRQVAILQDLEHPGIAALHGFDSIDGRGIVTMELTRGVPLEIRLSSGPFPVDEAISIAEQIAEALAFAHRRHVIHGHLSTANVKIDESGAVKIHDFGLERAISTLEPEELFERMPTVERPLMRDMSMVGTAAYMSPEQAHGKADERADVWAFALLLWEMTAGANPFERGSVSETVHAVIHDEPDWSQLPDDLPPHVERLLRLCLQKRPRIRLRSMADALLELRTPFASSEAPPGKKDGMPWRERLAWSLAALLGLAVALLLLF